MSFKRILPVASVLAVGALAFSIRTATATPVPSPALDDATIVAIFDQANTSDIETGQLAMKMGGTKEIRDFGARLGRDHKTVRQQGRDLAKKPGVKPTAPSPNDGKMAHGAVLEQLRSLTGADFDKAFLQNEVGYHDAVIAAVTTTLTTTLLPSTQNAELKDLVAKVAPAFIAHRDAAKYMLDRGTMSKL